jgi:hypothetical protein
MTIQKQLLKWCWKMSAHAHFLRCFFLVKDLLNDGMKVWIVGSRRSRAHLKWAWNVAGPKLLTPIAPNKNGQLSCKNLDVMIGATNLQLPKDLAKTITFAKSRHTPPLKMGRKTCQWTRGTSKHSKKKKLDPRSVPNTNAPLLRMCKV